MVEIISVVIGDHFGGGDHFDGGDHFGGGTPPLARKSETATAKNIFIFTSFKLVPFLTF